VVDDRNAETSAIAQSIIVGQRLRSRSAAPLADRRPTPGTDPSDHRISGCRLGGRVAVGGRGAYLALADTEVIKRHADDDGHRPVSGREPAASLFAESNDALHRIEPERGATAEHDRIELGNAVNRIEERKLARCR